MKSAIFLKVFIIISLFCHAQKRLYYGFHAGPSYGLTQRFLIDQQHPSFKYYAKAKPALGFMLEYRLIENVVFRWNIKRTSYMSGYSFNPILSEQSYDSLTQVTVSRHIAPWSLLTGVSKNHHDLSLQFLLPLGQSRFNIREGIGVVIVPGLVKYTEYPPYTEVGNYPLLTYYTYTKIYTSNRFNYGISANLGFDYKFGKKHDRFFYLNMDYTKCFVENERVNIDYTINGQSYKAQIKSYGDYFSAQIGYKAPWSTLRSKKKREELKLQNR